jgi:hypothetical protein
MKARLSIFLAWVTLVVVFGSIMLATITATSAVLYLLLKNLHLVDGYVGAFFAITIPTAFWCWWWFADENNPPQDPKP